MGTLSKVCSRLLAGHARPVAALRARPAEWSTDQRKDTLRVNRTDGSDHTSQDYPILTGAGRNRLTIIRITDGPDRRDRADVSEPFGVANRGVLSRLNWWKQHLRLGGCCGTTIGLDEGSHGTGSVDRIPCHLRDSVFIFSASGWLAGRP